jgi:hypothetical protein
MKALKVIFWLPTLIPAFIITFIIVAYQHYRGIAFISPELNIPFVKWFSDKQSYLNFINFLFWIIIIYLLK